MLNYDSDTKNAYKDDGVAQKYHDAFAHQYGPGAWRFRLVARYERSAVARLLRMVSAKRVLDVPCGTGKLASVFSGRPYELYCADISEEMIQIARASYADAGCDVEAFQLADVEVLAKQFSTIGFDLVVCLRLMHRVPSGVRVKMLEQIAKTAPHAIISFGVASTYHRIRRTLRGMLLGGDYSGLSTSPISDIRAELSDCFDILKETHVLKGVSEEVLFLVKTKLE